jgi:hypothetical protein
VQPVWLQTSRDHKPLDYRKKRRIWTNERCPKALSKGHYSRRPGEM